MKRLMRKLTRTWIIAGLALAFAVSALHAEEQKPAQGFSAGFTQGAAKGAGQRVTDLPPDGGKQKSANKNSDQMRAILLKPAKKKATDSGAPREDNRQ